MGGRYVFLDPVALLAALTIIGWMAKREGFPSTGKLFFASMIHWYKVIMGPQIEPVMRPPLTDEEFMCAIYEAKAHRHSEVYVATYLEEKRHTENIVGG